jgi:hypothetical protein
MKNTTTSTRSTSASHNGQADSDTNRALAPLKRFRIIRNTQQLREVIAEGLSEFRLLLKGGGYSAKTLTAASKGRFHVVNHIDGSSQVLTEAELSTQSNIGEAIAKGAFIAEEQSHE